MTKETISRVTYALTRFGYLRVNRMNSKFPLGSAVLSLRYLLPASLTVRQIARSSMMEQADHIRDSVSLGMRDQPNVAYLESSRSSTPPSLPADIGLSYPIVRIAVGRARLAALHAERREALLNEIAVKSVDIWATFRERVLRSIDHFQERGFCASYGDLGREVHAVAVPIKPSPDGEIFVFNCGMPSYLLKEGQLEGNVRLRLVSMVRGVEGAMGMF
ncbi:IclR family transcriptional regulator C-terminal domain-containing protein [Paraburkholderia fungorum]|uniref:IclR family transcriptional regulator n=1 Tax=Paraburkholderia fungorum TaxID=134537 RepID=UPI0038BD366B